jgi:hypothetical protein
MIKAAVRKRKFKKRRKQRRKELTWIISRIMASRK